MKLEAEDLAYTLNERLFELLSLAEHSDLAVNPWRDMDEAARKRMARLPFPLAEVHFLNPPWWLLKSGVEETQSVGHEAIRLPRYISQMLAQEVLMFAWHEAHSDADKAVLTVGMAPEVATILARMHLGQIGALVASHGGELAIRWMDKIEMWEGMAESARKADEKRLSVFHLHLKLLLMGDLRACAAKARR